MIDPAVLADALRALRAERDQRLRAEHDRSLPFADGLFDRWERAARLGFGEGASIYDSASVFGDVAVGDYTWVGPAVLLDGTGGGLSIGTWCSVSAGVQVYTHDTVAWAVTGGRAEHRTAPVAIGDRCYLGPNSVVAAGTVIGDGVIVGAGSFVRGELPPGTFWAGSPARRLGDVEVIGDTVRIRRR